MRAFEENKECLLPVRLDDTVVPGIMLRIAYVHKKDVTIAELVGLIQKKLHGFSYPANALPRTGIPLHSSRTTLTNC